MAPRKTTTKKRKTDSSQKTIRDYKPVKHEKIRKPKEYKQQKVPGTNKAIDRQTSAKLPGWRTSASGNRYFERRENRSDTKKEQKYHGGVNRRAKPDSDEKTVKSRAKKTSKRLPAYRKLDKQKPRATTGSKKSKTPPVTRSKKPKTETQIINSIKKYENLIRNRKTEFVFALDDFGNVVFKNGEGIVNKCSVRGMPFDCAVVTHNHPSSSAFSGADLAVAVFFRAKVIRVCSETYDYQLKPKNKFWTKMATPRIQDDAARDRAAKRVSDSYNQIKKELNPKYLSLFREELGKEVKKASSKSQKPLSNDDLKRIEKEVTLKTWHAHSNEILSTMAEKYNWSYVRIKRR